MSPLLAPIASGWKGPGDRFQLIVDGTAEFDDRAIKQDENAYPGGDVRQTWLRTE